MGPTGLHDVVVLEADNQYWAAIGTYSVGVPWSSVLFLPGSSNMPGAVNHKAYHSLLQRMGPHSKIPGACSTPLTPGLITTECSDVSTPLASSFPMVLVVECPLGPLVEHLL